LGGTSGYYAWLKRLAQPVGPRAEETAKIDAQIFDICDTESRGTYGSRRYTSALRNRGIRAGRARVIKRMRTLGVAPKKRRRYKATTNSNHGLPVAENLLQREFTVSAPDHIWVGDITYVSIGDRFGYLATVLDLFSRRIVGWAFDIHMESDLVVKAFGMAERARRPLKGLIFHSDRGSQYASELFRNKLKDAGGIQSMSRKGDCWDNAVAESFFHTIKNEYLCYQKFESSFIAELKILDYIAWYNRVRIHGTCGGVSPVQYENAKLLCA